MPVLIETFVETPRYTGAVYRASGWTMSEPPRAGGRYDRDKLFGKPPQGRLASAPPTRLAADTQSVKPSLAPGCGFSLVDEFPGPTERLPATAAPCYAVRPMKPLSV